MPARTSKNRYQENASRSLGAGSTSSDGDEALVKLVHWRVLKKNLDNLIALVKQRKVLLPDMYRKIVDRGEKIEAALTPPDEGTGLHGSYQGEWLARELLNDINSLNAFALKQGQTPTIIRLLTQRVESQQEMRFWLQTEFRPLLQAEIRLVLREELGTLWHHGSVVANTTASGAEARSETGLLTDLAPDGQATIDALFH